MAMEVSDAYKKYAESLEAAGIRMNPVSADCQNRPVGAVKDSHRTAAPPPSSEELVFILRREHIAGRLGDIELSKDNCWLIVDVLKRALKHRVKDSPQYHEHNGEAVVCDAKGAEILALLSALKAESLAQKFHETYERLAPQFSYQTRKASAVPWENVPENNKKLMIAVAKEILRDRF